MSKKRDARNVIKLVRKSNELVEARYKFDIWETRVFTRMLTMIRKDDEDFQSYRIYLKDIVKEFQLENNNDAYDRLRAGGMKLMTKIVKVVRNTDEGLMELNTPIVVGMESLLEPKKHVEDAKFIDISFHPGMKPFLLSLKSHFTTYDVRNILKLPSSYSIRIYELLKQYQRIGKRKFLVKELKEIIGVIEEIDINGKKKYKDNYPLYGNFKQRVLLKAQRDLKEYTDITFTFDQIKKGRAVSEVIFYIFQNTPNSEAIPIPSKPKNELQNKGVENIVVNEIHENVKEWVSMSVVRNWVKKYPEEQIRTAINYTFNQLEAGKDIDNVGGYLQKMVAEKDLVDPKIGKKKSLVKKKKKKEERRQLKERYEDSLKMLQLEFLHEEDKVIQQLIKDNPDSLENIQENVKNSRFSNYNHALSFEENLKNPMARAAYRNVVKKEYAYAFEEVKFKYDEKIRKLKLKMESI